MKRIKILLVLILLPLACSAQLVGIGAQYADAKDLGNNIQFAANLAYPTWHKKNPLNIFVTSGIDYTGGSTPTSGLNIKPIQINHFFSESFFNNHQYTVMLGLDAGYLFNFRGGEDGIVLTPNLYADYKFVFIKAGYDFNVTGGENQFFVRAGVCISIGSFKAVQGTKIW